VITAVATRPVAPGAFIALIAAGAALAAGFGYDLDPEVVGAVGAAVTAVLALVARHQVSPAPALAARS
jgi:hypothetical protein